MVRSIILMCNSPLLAANLFYYHWLMNKAASANGLAEQSQVGNSSKAKESRWSQGDIM